MGNHSLVIGGAELQQLQIEINEAFELDRARIKQLESQVAKLQGKSDPHAEKKPQPEVVPDTTPEEEKVPVNPAWEGETEQAPEPSDENMNVTDDAASDEDDAPEPVFTVA